MLDSITKTYRTYNAEYIKIVEAHPDTMDRFFRDCEKECLEVFKLKDEAKREEIVALFTKETEERQRKLEEAALKKLEEEKKAEEAKAAEEEQQKGKPAGKAPPAKAPAKKGKEPDKPVLDVPKLEVPAVQEYETGMGNKYLVERTMDEISTKILSPSQEEEEPNTQDGQEAAKLTEQPSQPELK